MNPDNRWLAALAGLAILAGLSSVQAAADQDKDKDKPRDRKNAGRQPAAVHQPPFQRPDSDASPPPPARLPAPSPKLSEVRTPAPEPPIVKPPPPPVTTKPTSTGYEKMTPTGRPREVMVKKYDGREVVEQRNASGRVEQEVIKSPDQTVKTTSYDLGHRQRSVVVEHPDKSTQTTDTHYNRNGQVRLRETVKTDTAGAPVSKTVVVQNNLIIKNTTVIKRTPVVRQQSTVVRQYVPCHYGYVYRPVVVSPYVYASWYDPFWYHPVVVGGPMVVVSTHSFYFSWGWQFEPWYVYHRAYWEPYPVYVAPSYWVTDWMVAGYMADRYAVAVNVEQTRKEVELARAEAAKANETARAAQAAAEQAKAEAEWAKDEAEQAKFEARTAALEAELKEAQASREIAERRANLAEERIAREERRVAQADQPNPNAKPIDKATKDALNAQIEATIQEKQKFAELTAKGENPAPPDVTKALADPNHIYPVSKTMSVVTAKDSSPAGNLTAGDLLRLEPGQEPVLKSANATTMLSMRVINSKGEEDGVAAGTVVQVPLKELQEFDNEFRAKLDQGLELATQNKDTFKQAAGKYSAQND